MSEKSLSNLPYWLIVLFLAILTFKGIKIEMVHSGKTQIKHEWSTWDEFKIKHLGR